MRQQILAAIDIGSNSLKLAIAEVAKDRSFSIIGDDRAPVRLRHHFLPKRILSGEAIELTSAAIEQFCAVAASHNAEKVIVVATDSIRRAKNRDQFVKEIDKRSGLRIDVLSPKEEARLIGISAAAFFQGKHKNIINIDIGGGSTEISFMKSGKPKKLFSVELGAVGLTQKHLRSDPTKEGEIKKMREHINLKLSKPARKLVGRKWGIASGTSGSILSLAALSNFESKNNPEGQSDLHLKRLIGLNKLLARLNKENRAHLPFINERRAEVIIAGGQILECAMSALEIQKITPCEYALREGVIIDFIRNA